MEEVIFFVAGKRQVWRRAAVGKMLERLMRSRIAEAICPARELSSRQFGFEAERPTPDVVTQVLVAKNIRA